ncbi:MAG: CtsR family transcriptional regulator [Clostridiales bacterium]|nr:CtsR family transcriptional regulator [Clostridiales bacterium]
MANISDIIEQFLLSSLGQGDRINISRNELADYFACAPSQINYVLTTRFTLDRGYLIESRRGGGGYVTLVRIGGQSEILDELSKINISEGISYNRGLQLIDRLVSEEHLSKREGELIKSLLSDKSLVAPGVNKDTLRASLIKNLALHLSKREV